MNDQQRNLQFSEIGKGFILNQCEGLVGRVITKKFIDQYKKLYVKINGEYVLLTEEHCYLSIS